MTASARVADLAAQLTTATGRGVSAEPSPPGRGDVFVFVDAPTIVREAGATAFCVGGRPVRLRASVVVVGAGTAPGQLAALLDIAEATALACDYIAGWLPVGDVVPATFADTTPAYSIPLITA